jgi:hypothetical protein
MASRTNADGSFDSPSFNAIGEPYVDPKPNSRSQSSAKPFLTCNPKVGQTASNWGDSKLEFKRLSEGEPYQGWRLWGEGGGWGGVEEEEEEKEGELRNGARERNTPVT